MLELAPGGDGGLAPAPLFTVFTPTYNRADTLPRVYRSLRAQTCRDFEWLIVDDGSTDGTDILVAAWIGEADFPIRYIRQPNGGKHVASNRAAQAARGALFLTFDSDDACLPWALARFKYHWEAIPADDRHRFSAVTALCADTYGRLIGNAFPRDVIDSDPLEMEIRHRSIGDKWGFQRTDLMREYPFPEFPGERHIPESVVWNRIGLRYKTRYVNEMLKVVEYLPSGLTASGFRTHVRNPRGMRLYYAEALRHARAATAAWRLRTRANYVRYSLHDGAGVRQCARGMEPGPLGVPAFLVGYLAYRRDRAAVARVARGG